MNYTLGPKVRAVIFDIGGPLSTEVEHERRIDADIRDTLAAEGIVTTTATYNAASHWAVEHFAPDAYAAIIWRLTAADPTAAARVHRDFLARHEGPPAFELRDGIAHVLAWLSGRGLLLGLAANQPLAMLPLLDAAGIGRYFHHREVSGAHGYRKPDVRLFLRCCEDLGVEPAECIMVGDRIDNDIAPARGLGMRTVLFRTGRHIAQQPRSPAELPHAEVRTSAELRAALESLL